MEERSSQDNFLCVAVALAQIELEEQRRIKSWHNLRGQEGDGGEALVAASSVVANGMYGEGSAPAHMGNIPPHDPDLYDELRRSKERSKNKSAQDEIGAKGKDIPSVPPIRPPQVGSGVHHSVVDSLREPGRDKKRKRKILSSVKIKPIDSKMFSRTLPGKSQRKK